MPTVVKEIESPLLPAGKAMEALHVSRGKFYDLLNSGQLKAVKMGGRAFVRVSEIHRFCENLPAYTPRTGAAA
ncbi:helix-turn-helix domain-containing protein [Phreatobacter aquaticus]|uniref:Helix-turn-helix domain-containing protein n=2 Tax=Phreatobacter aquaticus TaxID=2570229 RepID=A0A4D7QTC0_9HYPH|nr:helix-turn-helix domain-containing protein [Phreatobacter aquaticus]